MFISIIMWIFGGVLLLLGIVKTFIYINKQKEFKGYETIKGCVVEHISKEGYMEFDGEEFGYDAINYNEKDRMFLMQDDINTNAGIVEFVVNEKKYRILDFTKDTNLIPIGNEVIVKYNPKKPNDAFVSEDFNDDILYIVGIFLIILGIFIYFNF